MNCTNLLDVRNLHASIGEKEILKGINLTVRRGEVHAIMGPNGSGKSTLLRIIGTMDRPDEGTVEIEGMNVFEMKDKQLSKFRREKIGFIYQDYSLFPEFTAYENIVVPFALDNKNASEEEIDGILESLGISHCKGKDPSQRSGGEQQRVAIARAIATHPAVIFADEPTGNLDAESAKIVADMLSMASKKYNQTIIMVTHDMQMADHADRVLTIVDGNVKEGKLY